MSLGLEKSDLSRLQKLANDDLNPAFHPKMTKDASLLFVRNGLPEELVEFKAVLLQIIQTCLK